MHVENASLLSVGDKAFSSGSSVHTLGKIAISKPISQKVTRHTEYH